MRTRAFTLALWIALFALQTGGCRTPKGATPQEKREYALRMQRETLAELYRKRPEARSHVERAPGYAVFSDVASKILMVATGNGFGVATDNRSGRHTYMRMVEAGGGFGFGVKSYRAVYVFNSRSAFDSFVKGSWQVDADADLGAEYKGKGADVGTALTTEELAKPVTVYQFTRSGVNLSALATGTRYYPEKDLN